MCKCLFVSSLTRNTLKRDVSSCLCIDNKCKLCLAMPMTMPPHLKFNVIG